MVSFLGDTGETWSSKSPCSLTSLSVVDCGVKHKKSVILTYAYCSYIIHYKVQGEHQDIQNGSSQIISLRKLSVLECYGFRHSESLKRIYFDMSFDFCYYLQNYDQEIKQIKLRYCCYIRGFYEDFPS